jgi:thermitase
MLRRALVGLLVGVLSAPVVVGATPARVTLLVMFEDGASVSARDALHAAAGGEVTGWIPELSLARVAAAPWAEGVYDAAPQVLAVERPRHFELLGRSNDPLVKFQWGLKATGVFDGWRREDRKADIQVAVLDSGVDSTHIDLNKRVVDGYDYLEIDDDAYDDNGHGTHVAGIIAANAGNRKGVAGVSRSASIIPMKVCESGGSCDPFAIWLGTVDSVQRGADILNYSLGGAGECSDVEQAVFDWVNDQGVLAVVAAGNSGGDDNPTISPASCDHTLGVGAVDVAGKRAEFSSYGGFVDIAAPGVDIWSTLPPLLSLGTPTVYIGYASFQGTSMAAPFVAGAAAMVSSRHPDWTPQQISERLMKTATDVGPPGRDDRFGHGILNVSKALR